MHDTEVIAAHWPIFSGINGTRCACGWRESMPIADLSDHAAKIWAAHVQAELVRASTVTTEAELNALPEGTVVLWRGRAWTRLCSKSIYREWHTGDGGFIRRENQNELLHEATVLHRPV